MGSQERTSAWRRTLAAMLALAALTLVACGGEAGGGQSAPQEEAANAAAEIDVPEGLLKPGTLTVGTDFTNPPYSYIEGTERKGVDVEITAALAETLGLEPTAVDARFASLIPGLGANRFDAIVSDLYMNPERAKQVDYIPYFETGTAFLVREGDYQPQQPEDLCGHSVAILQGSLVEQLSLGEIRDACRARGEDLTVKSFPSDPEAYNEVVAGRADVHFADRAFAVMRAGEGELTMSSRDILYPVAVGIAVRKGDSEMREAIEQGIAELRRSGQLEGILSSYGLDEPDEATIQASLEAS